MNQADRVELSRAVAKALAYKEAGNDTLAAEWAYRVLELMGCAGLFQRRPTGF